MNTAAAAAAGGGGCAAGGCAAAAVAAVAAAAAAAEPLVNQISAILLLLACLPACNNTCLHACLQTQRVCEKMTEVGFEMIKTIEVRLKNHDPAEVPVTVLACDEREL